MFKRYFTNISMCFSVLLVLAASVPAAANDTMVITSESLEADRATNTAVFKGMVVARGDNMVLSASRMTVSYEESGSLKTLVAEGSVKLVKGLQVLTSQKAIYDIFSNSIVFTGEPRAVDEGNVLIGDKISYFLDEDRIKVEKSTMFIEKMGGDGEAAYE